MYKIEVLNTWSDYRDDWYDYLSNWDDDDSIVTFDQAEDALLFIETLIDDEYRREMALYEAALEKWLPRKKLYDERVQALKNVNLWTQEGEGTSPLMYPAMSWGADWSSKQPEPKTWMYRVTKIEEDDE